MKSSLRIAIVFVVCAAIRIVPAGAAPTAAATVAAFPAPGETIEVLAADQALPYLPLVLDLQVGSRRIDENSVDLVAIPNRLITLGPSPLRLEYVQSGKARPSARRVLDVYRNGLTQAGWIVETVAGSTPTLLAHYAQRGRNLWLKLSRDATGLRITQWEPAAQVQPAVLREALLQKGKATVYGIAFEIDKAYLRLPEAEPILRQILTLLKETPELKLEIRMHSDDSFKNVYGRRPTYDRARMIMQWLITKGIEPARLTAQGYEDSQPVRPNNSAENRAHNRRAELVRMP